MTQDLDRRSLRSGLDAVRDSLGNLEAAAALGAPSLVARTKAVSAYPTSAARCFACEPITILGAEAEGSVAQVEATGSTFLAYNLGSVVPPVSTIVLATFVNHRWVFRHDG